MHPGRKAEVLSKFFTMLPDATKQGISVVAMDMGPAYQKAVRETLPNADIVLDRFHVMQNFCKAMDNQRRAEFRKADDAQKKLIVGSRYLLLKHSEKLTETQSDQLKTLLHENQNINSLYILKEQLQTLWKNETVSSMQTALDAWCQLADETDMTYLKKFSKLLRKHKIGICNYAKYHLTTACIEAHNVGIGLIRKRARGIHDTDYFALKIRQLSVPDKEPIFYRKIAWATS